MVPIIVARSCSLPLSITQRCPRKSHRYHFSCPCPFLGSSSLSLAPTSSLRPPKLSNSKSRRLPLSSQRELPRAPTWPISSAYRSWSKVRSASPPSRRPSGRKSELYEPCSLCQKRWGSSVPSWAFSCGKECKYCMMYVEFETSYLSWDY